MYNDRVYGHGPKGKGKGEATETQRDERTGFKTGESRTRRRNRRRKEKKEKEQQGLSQPQRTSQTSSSSSVAILAQGGEPSVQKGDWQDRCLVCFEKGHAEKDCRRKPYRWKGADWFWTDEGWKKAEVWSENWEIGSRSETGQQLESQNGVDVGAVSDYRVRDWYGEWIKMCYDTGCASYAFPVEMDRTGLPLEKRNEFTAANDGTIDGYQRVSLPMVCPMGETCEPRAL